MALQNIYLSALFLIVAKQLPTVDMEHLFKDTKIS